MKRATAKLDRYISAIKADADFRKGAEPLYQIHPAGKKVYGTVILWHGGFSYPKALSMLGAYLFDNGFNVFLAPVAGHSFKGDHWPSTLLRKEYGGCEVKELLLADPQISELARGIGNGTIMVPVHAPHGFVMKDMIREALRILEEGLTPKVFDSLKYALNLLIREDYYKGFEKDIARFFESDHARYDTVPYAHTQLVSALPGPLHVGGFSMGALQSLFASARSKQVSRAVLMAPHFEPAAPPEHPEYRYLMEVVGVLDLYSFPMANDTDVPARIMPATDIAGRLAMQDDVLRDVRDNTDTFMVMAEDDGMGQFDLGKETYEKKIKNSNSYSFYYPAAEGISHFALPGKRNKYSAALAKEILRFYVTGNVHKEELMTARGDASLPAAPAVDAVFPTQNMSKNMSAGHSMSADKNMSTGQSMSANKTGHSMTEDMPTNNNVSIDKNMSKNEGHGHA